MSATAVSDDFFLPNFCDRSVVFAVVVLSELFAIILALAPFGGEFWSDLAFGSLFIQWVALTGAGTLCALRPYLRGLSNRVAAVVAWLLMLVLVAVFSDLTVRLAWGAALGLHVQGAEFVLRNMLIGAIISAIALRYFYVQDQWQRQLRAESEARIQALQARIRPHFLFNSMNTIASLVRSDPVTAEAAVEDLSDLFRASLGDARRLIPLTEELELCRRYLHMEGLRLGARLRPQWHLEGLPSGALIPPLTLQPLVENAIYHGIEPLPEGGEVRITGRTEGAAIVLTVVNPVTERPHSGTSGHRLALDNIRERLAAHYGSAGRLTQRAEAGRYEVELRLPCTIEAAS